MLVVVVLPPLLASRLSAPHPLGVMAPSQELIAEFPPRLIAKREADFLLLCALILRLARWVMNP